METKKYKMGPATRLEIGALVLEGALQATVLACEPLGVDQHAEAFVE